MDVKMKEESSYSGHLVTVLHHVSFSSGANSLLRGFNSVEIQQKPLTLYLTEILLYSLESP
jgi:hypothetical protein